MKVEYWSKVDYKKSEVLKVEDFPDEEEGFKKFYHENNSLKHCNGCYYTFQNPEDFEKYKEFLKTYHTITNYYNGGVVD